MLNYIKYGLFAIVISYFIFRVTYYKSENYKLSEKIKQLEAINHSCNKELRNLSILYDNLNSVYSLDIKDLKDENNDTNNTVIFDFDRL